MTHLCFLDTETTSLRPDRMCSPAAARAFVEQGWAPSLIGSPFGMFYGYQVAAGTAAHLEFLERQAGFEPHPSGTCVRHLEHGIAGAIGHVLPKQCVTGTDDRYYLVDWERGIPALLEDGVNPDDPMTSCCRADMLEVLP